MRTAGQAAPATHSKLLEEQRRAVLLRGDKLNRRPLGGSISQENLLVQIMEIKHKCDLGNHSRYVSVLEISTDGRLGISAGHDGKVLLYNLHSQQVVTMLQHDVAIRTAAFNDKCDRLTVLCEDRMIYIWDLQSSKIILQFPILGRQIEQENAGLGRKYITNAIFSPGANFLLAGSQDKIVYLIPVAPDARAQRFIGHKMPVFGVGFTDEDGPIWSYGQCDPLRYWDRKTRKELCRFGKDEWVFDAAISDDANIAAIATSRKIEVWDGKTAKLRYRLPRSFLQWEQATTMAFRSDTYELLTGTYQGKMILWDLESHLRLFSIQAHDSWVDRITRSSDGGIILSAGGMNKLVKLWELNP